MNELYFLVIYKINNLNYNLEIFFFIFYIKKLLIFI